MKAIFTLMSIVFSIQLFAQEVTDYDNSFHLNHSYGIYHFTEKNDFVHVECSFLQTTNPYYNAHYLAKTDLINGLKKIAISVEGNKKISPRFHLGIKPKLAIDPEFNIFSIKPNIIHNGNIYKVQFIKELGLTFSQSKLINIDGGSTSNQTYSKTIETHINLTTNIRVALAYKFRIKKKLPIRTMLSLNGYIIKEFDAQYIGPENERTFNYSTLKLNVNTLLFQRLNVGIFGLLQNKYVIDYYTDQNKTIYTPMLGWEINYFLGKINPEQNYSFIF
jgi:hypothetical protein